MTTPDPNDLASLDRDVARARAAWVKWRRALMQDPEAHADEAPLDRLRHVAGQGTYDALAGDDPHRVALRRWVYALLQARIGQPLDVEMARAAAETSARHALPRPHLVSWNEAHRGLLAAETVAERAAWLESAEERGPALAAIARRRRERREEAAKRMGFGAEGPLFAASPEVLSAAAEALLARTDDLARDELARARRRADLPTDPPLLIDAVTLAVARDAPEGWPANLSVRWLEGVFGDVARGLKLGALVLPEALGASSFARACAAFGAALRVAGAAPSLPFAMAQDPEPTAMHRFGCVFGALPASAAFQRRVLGNVARIADAQARVLARTALLGARLEAARLLLGDAPSADRYEELTSRLFGAPAPRALRGAWPSVPGDVRARFVGLVTAAALAKDLVERFDVDWFANPRAATHLRAIASGPGNEPLPEDLAPHVGGVARAFVEALA
jgi:hypothetical protein